MTPEHLRHQDVMRKVARALRSVPYVLKGGTALLLPHGLDPVTSPILVLTLLSQLTSTMPCDGDSI